MKIIIGLGNPGRRYQRTRHNAGFMAADELAKALRLELTQEKYDARMGRTRIGSETVVIAEPQTFMNESGRSVHALVRYTAATVSDVIVLHDDLDLRPGAVRVKLGGGHGGHNGLRSIIEHLGTQEFVRVRIGIGRPEPGTDSAEYVLGPFPPGEREIVFQAVVKAAEAATTIVREGPTRAMNIYNQR